MTSLRDGWFHPLSNKGEWWQSQSHERWGFAVGQSLFGQGCPFLQSQGGGSLAKEGRLSTALLDRLQFSLLPGGFNSFHPKWIERHGEKIPGLFLLGFVVLDGSLGCPGLRRLLLLLLVPIDVL